MSNAKPLGYGPRGALVWGGLVFDPNTKTPGLISQARRKFKG
ncbi:hypothetical protein [Phaeobacter gallaeciensis]|nr:hypothetical protein [Phaeobacter gallaeciensis]